MGRWGDFWYYQPSVPRKAKGGIKAQGKRGAFGEKWWAKRWIEVLESFDIGARLGRGRSYARRGQVLSIDIEKGRVGAKVQGSRPKPYEVTIRIKTLPPESWKRLAGTLSQQALFLAKLLSGEMPEDIEKAFAKGKISLFPERLKDLETQCSCPDWSNPCKHIAAVYYLLGEEFDRDPFLIFKLRGMSREELLDLLGGAGKRAPGKKGRREPAARGGAVAGAALAGRAVTVGALAGEALEEVKAEAPPSEPLPTQSAQFWEGGKVPEDFFGEVQIPPLPGALLRRLGNFPFWRGQERLLDALEPVYRQASAFGMDVFLGEGTAPKALEESRADRYAPRRPRRPRR